MRIKPLLATAVFGLFTAVSANAAVIISLTNPVQTYTGGTQTFTFGGSIYETNPPPVIDPYILYSDGGQPDTNGGSFPNPTRNDALVTFNDTLAGQIGNDLPIALDAGNGYTYTNPDMFTVTVGAGFSFGYPTFPDNLLGDFNVTNYDVPETIDTPFQIVNTTPEPGSLALLISCGLGSGALCVRRRAK